MQTLSLYPFRRLNVKAAMLVPLLLLSMFTIVPITTGQIAPSLAKISPTLWSEMAKASESVSVLIKTFTNDYASIIKQINDLGGNVGLLFEYVSGLSASLPANKIVELSKNSMIERIYYDVKKELASDPGESLIMPRGNDLDALLAEPTAMGVSEDEIISITPAELASVEPANYWNTMATEAVDIWGETNYGDDSLVVIIDTGMWTGNFMFSGTSILGGIDLSYDNYTLYGIWPPMYEGWSNIYNHYHGGHVAGIVASTAGIVVHPTYNPELWLYAQALEMYSGVPLPPAPSPPHPAGSKIIWTLGMAPAATLYIVKVFDHTGGSIPESMVIAGMEHALNLKLVEGYDVDVVSMSIGGPTLYDGRDLEDTLVDIITANGITLVAAAGNEGPASMTVGSPGSAHTAITAGAAADPVHTRAYWDLAYGVLGIGPILFTSPTPQIFYYSSRGPTSDGRLKPTMCATGIMVLSAYTPLGAGGIAWLSGTSMATPAISGATALLNAYAEMHTLGASPEDYRQALTGGAVWLPGYDQYAQGAGYLNAKNALDLLKIDPAYGDVAPPLPPPPPLEDITNIPIVGEGDYTASITDLPPGHTMEFIFEVTEATDAVRLRLDNVYLGDIDYGFNSFEIYIQSAKRTGYWYYVESANVWGDAWFMINDDQTKWKGPVSGVYAHSYTRVLEPGYMKIVIENDWTSYDDISADIKIQVEAVKKPEAPDITIPGTIADGEFIGWYYFEVPKWAKEAKIQLWWTNGWDMYPTNDLDLLVYWDMGMNYDGATLNAPETVLLDKPTFIYIGIDGYTVYTGSDNFEVRIYFSK